MEHVISCGEMFTMDTDVTDGLHSIKKMIYLLKWRATKKILTKNEVKKI